MTDQDYGVRAGADGARSTDDRPSSWSDEGTFLVAPGVHRIPLPLPDDALKAVNVYAIEDEDGLTLVDAGWALQEALDRLVAALAELDHDLGAVRQFLVTHVHRDHYTLATVVRRMFGTRVSLGEHERANLRGIREEIQGTGPAPWIERLTAHGAAGLAERLFGARTGDDHDPAHWVDPDAWLRDGEAVRVGGRTLQVIHTPGHTRGHVVFVDREAALMFSGDHILPHITPSIGFESAPTRRPLGSYLSSLELVLGHADLRVLPAHGPLAPSVHARTRALLEHHERRLDNTERTLVGDERTAYEVAERLSWTRREHPFAALDDFNQMLAVMETAAHLDVLADRGRASSRIDRGITVYAHP